jgi:hypothetical protein
VFKNSKEKEEKKKKKAAENCILPKFRLSENIFAQAKLLHWQFAPEREKRSSEKFERIISLLSENFSLKRKKFTAAA